MSLRIGTDFLFLSGNRPMDTEYHHVSTQIGWVYVEAYYIETAREKDERQP